MVSCTYNAAKLAVEIYQLINAFQVQKVPSIVKRTITCIDKCQSFKYLKLTKACGNSVSSAAKNLKDNFHLYRLLRHPSQIKTSITALRSDLNMVKTTCVVVN